MPTPPPNSVHPKTRAEWRRWLEKHQAQPEGVWMVSFKKHTGQPRVAYEEAVEEALCFGWIDSIANVLDAARSMQWFSPRKPGSGWSRLNKIRFEQLLAAGRLAPAGLAKIEAAKRDGSWTALDASQALEVPSDLAAALAANAAAQQYFEAFPPSARRAILQGIGLAKRPETRAKRIAETVASAAQNIRANQWRP